ncbi:MAG: hypothetical protein HY707_13925 [Ignavibacteriae bacterium]|nr:hypothetical protein [Ignavibacteriota bacterium]
MPAQKNDSTKICYYCGAPAASQDHLPPSCIFPDPKPSNRISVPSCDQHNSAQSREDEYFRWFVATASGESPIAEALIKDKVVRQFQERPKLLRAILKHSGWIDVHTPSGIYVGKTPLFEYDRPRVQSVITRITKGFFYHFYGERLPDNYVVWDFLLNPQLDEEQKSILFQTPLHEIGGEVFSFRFQRDLDDPYFTAWLYMFYDQTLIATLTEKRPLGNGC